MTDSPSFKCTRCTMSFRVEEHRGYEHMRCPVCKLAFWCALQDGSMIAHVGITPKEFARVNA